MACQLGRGSGTNLASACRPLAAAIDVALQLLPRPLNLRSEGYTVILVNSNPATIMTDPGTADRT